MPVTDGKAVERLRANQGLSHRNLATKAKCSVRTIEKAVKGSENLRLATVTRIAQALGVRLEAILGHGHLAWFLGSSKREYQTPDEMKLISTTLRSLGPALVRHQIRIVMGESRMLHDLGRAYRAASPEEDFVSPAVMLYCRIRKHTIEHVFNSSGCNLPDVAVLLGGGGKKGIVQAEYEAAKEANIPLLAIPATGGMAKKLKTTAELPKPILSNCHRRKGVNGGDLADAIIEAILHSTH